MKKLKQYIHSNTEAFIEDLRTLCRQPSISTEKTGINECVEVLKDLMSKVGIEVQILQVTNGNPVVLGQVKNEDIEGCLGFYNHYDVVPIGPLKLWESPPFEAKIKEGMIIARGVSDNKGNIMARLAAVKAIMDVYEEVPVNLKFLIEGEEEIGSPHLPSFVKAKMNLLRADGYLWEGDGVDESERPVITLGAKGMLYLELRAHGPKQDLHSAKAPIVSNPVWQLIWLLSTLKSRSEKIQIPGWYDHVLPPTELENQLLHKAPFDEAAEKEALGVKEYLRGLSGVESRKALYLSPTCNISGISAGYSGPGTKTVLPSEAIVKIDFRLVEAQKPDFLYQRFMEYITRQGFTDVTVINHGGYEPAKTPADNPFIRKIIDTANQVYNRTPVIWPTTPGTSPIYVIKNWLNIPVASAGGVDYPGSNIHAPNENIRVKDYIKSIEYLATLICTYQKPQ